MNGCPSGRTTSRYLPSRVRLKVLQISGIRHLKLKPLHRKIIIIRDIEYWVALINWQINQLEIYRWPWFVQILNSNKFHYLLSLIYYHFPFIRYEIRSLEECACFFLIDFNRESVFINTQLKICINCLVRAIDVILRCAVRLSASIYCFQKWQSYASASAMVAASVRTFIPSHLF